MKPRYYCAAEKNTDLKVGDWVTPFNCRGDHVPYNDGYEELPSPRQNHFRATGAPQLIIGISLPFIAVKGIGPDSRMGIYDLRFYEMRKLEASYVQAIKEDWARELKEYEEYQAAREKRRMKRRKTAKAKKQRSGVRCPRCKARMQRQRLVNEGERSYWIYCCDNCGASGLRVEA